MNIRTVVKTDYEKIYTLVQTAFKTAQVSDGTEQDFVLKLREGDTYIPELEFVAEENEDIIGHIMFTKQVIEQENGEFLGLLVAPLCVKLEYRSQKVGAKLMEYGFREAQKMGYTAAFLIGNPEYYKKLGFRQTSFFNIQNTTEIPDEVVLACEIVPNSLKNVKGNISIKD